MIAGEVEIQRLCEHHVITGFDCIDDRQYNEILRRYKANVHLGIEHNVFVSVLNFDVMGFISACDLRVVLPYGSGLFFFFPALAVSKQRRGSTDASLLVLHAKDLMRHLEMEGVVYAGMAAAPGSNDGLIDVLEASGFTRNPYRPELWTRPLLPWPSTI